MELLAITFMAAVVGQAICANSRLKKIEELAKQISVEGKRRNLVEQQVASYCGDCAARVFAEASPEFGNRGNRDSGNDSGGRKETANGGRSDE